MENCNSGGGGTVATTMALAATAGYAWYTCVCVCDLKRKERKIDHKNTGQKRREIERKSQKKTRK